MNEREDRVAPRAMRARTMEPATLDSPLAAVVLAALALVILVPGGSLHGGVAFAKGGSGSATQKPFQVPRGTTQRLAAPRAGDLRTGPLPAFFQGIRTSLLTARLERERDGRTYIVLIARSTARPSTAYAVMGTDERGKSRMIPVEILDRTRDGEGSPPHDGGQPGPAVPELRTLQVVRGRTTVFDVPTGAQGASELRVVAAACAMWVVLAGVPDPVPGVVAVLGPDASGGPGGTVGPPLTKLKVTVTATAPLGGGRRLMRLRNGSWSLLPICIEVRAAPTAQAPGGGTPSEQPQAPTVFSRISVDTTAHRWVTAYLLSLAALYVYPNDSEDWTAFRQRFSEQFAAWGMTSSVNQDYIHDAASGTQCAVLHDDQRIVVVFRGSQSSAKPESASQLAVHEGRLDWTADLNAPYTVPGASWGPQVGVHTGFYAALETVYAAVRGRVTALRQGSQRRVFITGHSLGGALSMLCAYRLSHVDRIPVQGVYTYGQPRVGNAAFVLQYAAEELAARTFRWAHDLDLVPKLPPALAPGYRHAGRVNAVHANGTCSLDAAESLAPGGIVSHSMPGYCARIRACMPRRLRPGLPPAP